MTDASSAPAEIAPEGLSREEFFERSKCFLHDVGGVDTRSLDPDIDLVDAGVLDSLLLIAFLAFVEELRGHELEVRPEHLRAVRTLRTAYTLAHGEAPPEGRSQHGP